MALRLIYTPRSHFARKVRLLAAALAVPLELVDAGNAGEREPALFGPNPLMKVPTLLDGGRAVFESDHIAAHLVRTRDPGDRFAVLTTDVDALNARAVMNGVMAAEVELILAARSGMDTAQPRFDKMRAALVQGLEWLEAQADVFAPAPDYLGFHLVSLWDHLALYALVPLDGYPRLRDAVGRVDALPFVAESRPV